MIGLWHCSACQEEGENVLRGRDGNYFHGATTGHRTIAGARVPIEDAEQALAVRMEAFEEHLLAIADLVPQIRELIAMLDAGLLTKTSELELDEASRAMWAAYWHGIRPDMVARWSNIAGGGHR